MNKAAILLILLLSSISQFHQLEADFVESQEIVDKVSMNAIVKHAAKNLLKVYSKYQFIRLKRHSLLITDDHFSKNVTSINRLFADIYVKDSDGLEFLNNYSIDIFFSKDGSFLFHPKLHLIYSLDFYTNQLKTAKVDYQDWFKIEIT